MSPTGQQCERCVLSGQVATYTQAGNAKLLGERNSPCHRGKKKNIATLNITDNILERRIGLISAILFPAECAF